MLLLAAANVHSCVIAIGASVKTGPTHTAPNQPQRHAPMPRAHLPEQPAARAAHQTQGHEDLNPWRPAISSCIQSCRETPPSTERPSSRHSWPAPPGRQPGSTAVVKVRQLPETRAITMMMTSCQRWRCRRHLLWPMRHSCRCMEHNTHDTSIEAIPITVFHFVIKSAARRVPLTAVISWAGYMVVACSGSVDCVHVCLPRYVGRFEAN